MNEVYSKGVIITTSAFFAANDAKQWPKEPTMPREIKGTNSENDGIKKFSDIKKIDVNNNAKE